ncbi:carbohydrate ABC transporter permease [Ruminiclostridium cellobioparum]|uniref:carbohydrate ABC transporter permease n=1 Tax=Ruminiclostridium cellobioparum TaxID=29355 RepID=UPI0028A871E4|nr:carbohydrate ABC transporter permease [Ruminiclostridium cellobioparum]
MNYRITTGEKIFKICNAVILTFIGLMAILPFIHVFAKALSDNSAVISGKVTFLPVGLQLGNYEFILTKSMFLTCFRNSLFITIIGTLLSLFCTVTTAYPLSKVWLKGRKFFVLLYIFAMLFYGGIIPGYMLMKSLNLLDTLWSVIFPFMVVPFNMLVVKTFMEGLPESVEESAKIDGAGDIRILVSIILPMSMPVIATIGLFYAVTYWNGFFHATMYISKPDLKPLQQYIYEMINSANNINNNMSVEEMLKISPGGVQAAAIIATTMPIIIVYPFLQKYFVQGMTLGSVKG